MDGTKRAIAVVFAMRDDSKPINIRKPGKALVLLLHFAPDGIGLLRATDHFGIDPSLFKLVAHVASDPLDHITGFALQRNEPPHDRRSAFGVQHMEGEVFQFFPHPLHAHPPGQRCKNLHRFTRLLGLLFRLHCLDGAHVVQAVSQLDKDHSQIFRHRHKKLAEVFRLLGFMAAKLQVSQLGDTINQHRDLITESRSNFTIRCLGIFDCVVQQSGDDSGIIQTLLG